MFDTRGLVTFDREDVQDSYKKDYATRHYTYNKELNGPGHFLDVISLIKPHAIIGLSGQKGLFSKQVLKTMSELNLKPIIFSLSNPSR